MIPTHENNTHRFIRWHLR